MKYALIETWFIEDFYGRERRVDTFKLLDTFSTIEEAENCRNILPYPQSYIIIQVW